jgi:hypothetical protein
MTETEENELKLSIANKLRPERFPAVSPKMFALLAALLNQAWTNPRVASIVATSDGFLVARPVGSTGFDDFVGSFADFERNTFGMADAAGDLTEQEMEFLKTLLGRVEGGIETSSGDTASDLAIEGINHSSN